MSRKLYITLILILFLLPFFSWYYLRSGLKWRQEAQHIMNGTKLFPQGEWIDNGNSKFNSSQLDDHVTLITLNDCANIQAMSQMMDQFYDQFKETKKANYIILDTCNESSVVFTDPLKTDWHVFDCNDTSSLYQSLLSDWPAGKTHALVDKNQTIRSYYASSNKDEKRILLEHMALLLPRDRADKVELKRGKQK